MTKISSIQEENAQMMRYTAYSLTMASNTLRGNAKSTVSQEGFQAINEYVFQCHQEAYKKYRQDDFAEVFKKYLNN